MLFTCDVSKLSKFIEVKAEQLLNIYEVPVTEEELKFDKSISIISTNSLNIFLQLFILLFHSNLIIKSSVVILIILIGESYSKVSLK